jgi:N-acetylglucosamine kinase-like BadF-type ATPase
LITHTTSKKFLLGIDIGSTKTHAMLADTSGQVLGFAESGCGNYEVVGVEGMTDALHSAVSGCLRDVMASKEEILAVGLGIAGYDWPSEKPMMLEAIKPLEIVAEYAMVNDVEIGLIAGAPDGWGIAVDAGTGNNIRGRDKDGRVGRITGSSIPFGEFGGAAEMVWYARIAATYAWTKRGPKTKLTTSFMNYAEVESEDALIEGLATQKINLSPILAKEIIEAARQGDKVALDVVEFSARELGKNVNAVIQQLSFQDKAFDIVLIGSLFKAGDIYTKPFFQVIHQFAPNARLVPLHIPPVAGAVILAAETVNLSTQEFRDNVRQSTLSFLEKQEDVDKN